MGGESDSVPPARDEIPRTAGRASVNCLLDLRARQRQTLLSRYPRGVIDVRSTPSIKGYWETRARGTARGSCQTDLWILFGKHVKSGPDRCIRFRRRGEEPTTQGRAVANVEAECG